MSTTDEGTRITATELGRELSDILNRVEYRGESFVIERKGRVIGALGPSRAGAPAGRKTNVEAWFERWRRHSPAAHGDPGFADAVERFRNDLPPVQWPRWPGKSEEPAESER